MLSQDVRLSVRPSVCHTQVLCWNGYFFHRQVARRYRDIPTGTSLIGASNTCEFWPMSRLFSEMVQDTVMHYYAMRTANRSQTFEWYHFQWHWPRVEGHAVTWRRISQKRYEMQTVTMRHWQRFTHALPTGVISNDLECPWVTYSEMYNDTSGASRSLCDSWASCLVGQVADIVRPAGVFRKSQSKRRVCFCRLQECYSVQNWGYRYEQPDFVFTWSSWRLRVSPLLIKLCVANARHSGKSEPVHRNASSQKL